MQLSEKEWKERLTPEQYRVLREQGTERPFTGKYVDHEEDGSYRCAGCGAVLFSSDHKIACTSGWPAFDRAVADGAVELREDNSWIMRRTEVVCANCKGHLGHVFEDGPKETTGERFCINSAALDFKKASMEDGENTA